MFKVGQKVRLSYEAQLVGTVVGVAVLDDPDRSDPEPQVVYLVKTEEFWTVEGGTGITATVTAWDASVTVEHKVDKVVTAHG